MTARVRESMRRRLSEYGEAHRTRGNELCHFVGVPLIVLGAGRLLGALPLGQAFGVSVTLAHGVLLAIGVFYVVQARVLGVITLLAMLILVGVGLQLPLWFGLAAFLAGWAVQFIGHARYERRSPAFFQNLVHLLVGPAWLMERALFR